MQLPAEKAKWKPQIYEILVKIDAAIEKHDNAAMPGPLNGMTGMNIKKKIRLDL